MSAYTSQFNLHSSQPLSNSLTPIERKLVVLTQSGLPVIPKPFEWLAEQLQVSLAETLVIIQQLQQRGVIRRIAAVPNHYRLGYRYNGMTVWDVTDSQANLLGKRIAQLPFVSHCYLRPRHLPEWPFNLFAMIHARKQATMENYRSQIRDVLGKAYQSDDVLVSSKILKKTGLRLLP
ncbi:Lrp/AsnC family transcriptional regulator [Endozoicomonas sp. SM1973]|uniref:siroheme decarboxylase n=1 Tax=Spartinivicinus marinus TaxID=2994442 RepID=A0A853IG49_9GAMM|nr:Lrp/AsnC family transcriptional regulator [Spartinivicinus marinus]MCX4024849.1 Lrp/AsnC family transcriptional regulator [Spartinivicinus marinus]NYZ66506.1 Lrp/AsnC family transcriptional regulator [Spartinivicinus marinus]